MNLRPTFSIPAGIPSGPGALSLRMANVAHVPYNPEHLGAHLGKERLQLQS